jgi:hypothetical protein
MDGNPTPSDINSLLNTIREHYHAFVEVIGIISSRELDPYPLQRFGEDLQEFTRIVDQVRLNLSELLKFCNSLYSMEMYLTTWRSLIC